MKLFLLLPFLLDSFCKENIHIKLLFDYYSLKIDVIQIHLLFCRKIIQESMNNQGQKLPLHLAIIGGRNEELNLWLKTPRTLRPGT